MDSSYDNDTVWKRQRLTKYVKTTKWRIAENNGRTYYYDKNEMKSQWDKPKEIEEFELSLEQELINRKQVLLSERVASPTVDDNSVGSNKDDKDRDNHYGSDYDRDRDEDRDGDRYESEDGDAMDVDSYGKHQSYGDSDKEENYHMQGNETADNDSDHTDYGDDNYGFDNDSHYGSDRGDNDSYQSDNSEKSDHHSPAINEDKGDSQPNSSTKVDAAIAVIATKVVDEALLLEQEKSSMLKKLSLPDSVLELGAYETGATCTQKFQIPPATVVKSFIDSYVGYPAMCQLVLELMNHTDNIINNSYTKSTATKGTTGMKHSSNSRTTSVVEKADTAKNISSNDDWLAFVTQDNVDSGSDKKNDKDVSQSNPFHTKNESRVVDIICNIIKEKFDVRASDQLLMKLTSTPPWLVSLMEDSTYRSLLLELADSHSDSAFLRLCLKELSMKGYNKEISRVMKDPEHFEVLNNILSDLLPEVSAES